MKSIRLNNRKYERTSIAGLGVICFASVRYFWPTSLIFDQTLLYLMVTFALYVLYKIVFFKAKVKETASLLMLPIIFIYIFNTSILMNIDRSRSMYIFKMVENCKISTQCEYNNEIKYGTVGIADFKSRINEQISRGFMLREDNKIKLTPSGRLMYKLFNFLAKVFVLEGYKKA